MDNLNYFIEAFKKLDTCCVSDALDHHGIYGGMETIVPITSNEPVICGPAFTVRYIARGSDKRTIGDFLDDVKSGQVIVIDNQGRTDCTIWGDIMSFTATMKKIAGTVIHGVCRDVKMIRELKYPVYAKGHFMVTGKDRVELDAVNVPISIEKAQICPGDLILADCNGVVVIPKDQLEPILKTAKDIDQKEKEIIADVKKGLSLAEARKKTGYHHLQTRE